MASGTYGNIRESDVNIKDIEIFYVFTPSRETPPSSQVFTLDATQVLKPITNPINATGVEVLGGLYNLTLPSIAFNTTGIYNIFIRPKQIRTVIADCGVLSAIPSQKGIVLDTTRPELQQESQKLSNGGLTGFRIEYLNSDGTKKNNFFRIVTSANRCEAVNENLNNTSQKSVRYRFNDSGSLLYLTLSPSTSASITPNLIPFIGSPGDSIIISNTYFNPIMLEVELVDVDLQSIGDALFGNQIKDTQSGVVTIYDKNGNITRQFNLFTIESETNQPLYDVREIKTQIDNSQDFEAITTGL